MRSDFTYMDELITSLRKAPGQPITTTVTPLRVAAPTPFAPTGNADPLAEGVDRPPSPFESGDIAPTRARRPDHRSHTTGRRIQDRIRGPQQEHGQTSTERDQGEGGHAGSLQDQPAGERRKTVSRRQAGALMPAFVPAAGRPVQSPESGRVRSVAGPARAPFSRRSGPHLCHRYRAEDPAGPWRPRGARRPSRRRRAYS